MHRPFVSWEGRRQDSCRQHRVRSAAACSLFGRGHTNRYFGALWFKVFNERGPC